MDYQTRSVPPDEQRRDADIKYENARKDGVNILAWLQWRRDHAAADRWAAEQRDDQVGWARYNDECAMYALAATEIELARERIALMAESLKNRPAQ